MERSRWTYILALQRGLEVAGSEARLARRLGIPVSRLRSYLTGAADVPAEVFLQVVDLLYPLGSMNTDPAIGNAGKPASLSHPFFAPDFLPKDRHTLLESALEAAMSIAGTDLGNIQLLDGSGALRIEMQQGFFNPFLKFFDRVSGPDCACGAALKDGQQIFVEDVMSDPLFADNESGRVVLDAGVRAVTSSPITNQRRRVIGMLSIHHRRPKKPEDVDLMAQSRVAQRIAQHLLGKTGAEKNSS